MVTRTCTDYVKKRVQMILSAIKLNLDEVYTRCATYKTIEHIFADDIFSHKNCMKRYLLQYQRNADEIVQEDGLDAYSNDELHEAFNKMTSELNLATSRYSISACHDIMNENLEEYTVNNRKVKRMLIAHFGEEICFTYPRDKSKPEMFYLTNISPADLVETIRRTDPVKICAEKLRKEREELDFL